MRISDLEIEALRPHAVRGELTPGVYRDIRSHLNFEDYIVVTKTVGVPDALLSPGCRRFEYFVAGEGDRVPKVRRAFFSDYGVDRYKRISTETCNLGHEHTVTRNGSYNETNFLVPAELELRYPHSQG